MRSCILIGLMMSLSLIVTGQQKNPNIIFILTDDLGYYDVSFTGAKDVQTPNIDKLAREGLIFTNFYANSTVCSPSRAAFLTGRFPDLVGVPGVIRQKQDDSYGFLSPSAITLADRLTYGGYHTALIGKWHLGHVSPNLPNERGFHHFKGFLGGMVDDYWGHLRMGVNWMRENEMHINPEGHCTDLITGWTIDYIKQREKMQNPFFLYLAYNAPHSPIQPPKEYLEKVIKRENGISEKRAKLVALVEHLDDGIGKVLNQLKESGFDENTIIVFTSDNGGSLYYGSDNGPYRGGKSDMYEGGIKVPLAVKWPMKIKAGTQTDKLGILMDFYPTLCELANVPINHEIDGISLSPILEGKELNTEDRILHWMRKEGKAYGGRTYYASRYKGMKVLQNNTTSPMEYYNIVKDQAEKLPLDQDNKLYKLIFKAQHDHILESGKVIWKDPRE